MGSLADDLLTKIKITVKGTSSPDQMNGAEKGQAKRMAIFSSERLLRAFQTLKPEYQKDVVGRFKQEMGQDADLKNGWDNFKDFVGRTSIVNALEGRGRKNGHSK